MNDWRLKENGVKIEKKLLELKLGNSAKRRELRLEVELVVAGNHASMVK